MQYGGSYALPIPPASNSYPPPAQPYYPGSSGRPDPFQGLGTQPPNQSSSQRWWYTISREVHGMMMPMLLLLLLFWFYAFKKSYIRKPDTSLYSSSPILNVKINLARVWKCKTVNCETLDIKDSWTYTTTNSTSVPPIIKLGLHFFQAEKNVSPNTL